MTVRRWIIGLTAAVGLGTVGPGFAQAPGPIKRPVEAVAPAEDHYRFDVLQTIPVSPTVAGLPALPNGILSTARCIVGTATGAGPGEFVPIRFVGNVLCLDPGPAGDFPTFLCGVDCPGPAVPVLQGVKLRKVEPRIPKCPEVYPGVDVVMTPQGTGIRTWWPLKLTPCGTELTLSLEVTLITPEGSERRVPGSDNPRDPAGAVRVRNFTFRVIVTPETLSWVIEALHNEPLGLCEVPCITDEGLFDLLLRQAETIRVEAAGGRARLRELNTALDTMEATVVARCLFLLSAAEVRLDERGNVREIIPCAVSPTGAPLGNFTVSRFGWGIVDTLENPCCCKLIADLTCLKRDLIGNDP